MKEGETGGTYGLYGEKENRYKGLVENRKI